jgi:hypothetical protein
MCHENIDSVTSGQEAGTMRDDWSPLDAGGRDRRPWFGRKQFGWGWSPRTWPGYLLTAALLAVIELIAVGTRHGWVPYLAAAIPLAVFAVTRAAGRGR